ncbi:hypothetical protein HY494_01900 [Candidatus Woesearchaeota archaeon]|nr:hypothetical protein [Candidatus Woesearchaeota archaeon]
MVEVTVLLEALVGYAVLSVVSMLAVAYALFRFNEKILRLALWKMVAANFFIGVGVVVHTMAILEYGTDNALVMEFSISHIFLLLGFLLLTLAMVKIQTLSKKIGFA